MELPAYRLPSFKSVFLNMWDKAKDFIVKAFTIIFFATIIIWLMQSFDFSFDLVSDSSNSILAYLGKIIAPIFVPLGFSDWRVATALVTGLTAKEAVVSTMTVLMKIGGSNELLSNYFTTASAFSFLVFTLLYMPCVATLAAIKREMGGLYNALLVMAFQTIVAWIVAFIVYHIIILF
jgi:ferrous iron transport protein B